MSYTLTVNDRQQIVDVPGDPSLIWVIRDVLNLKGTKFGYGIAQCGACAVHININGAATRSCQTMLQTAAGKSVTTLEGLSGDDSHPV